MPKQKKIVRKKTLSSDRNHKGSIVESTEMVLITSLNQYHKNPNIGDPEKTAESLKNNGQFRSIVVNRGSKTGRPNEVLAGNHTLLGAKKLNWTKIQVDWVDVSDEHAVRIVLADNGSRDGSKYDDKILAELLEGQKQDTGTLVGTTLTDDMLSGLLKSVESEASSDGVNKVEEADENLTGLDDLKNGIFFESSEDYEIPSIRLDMIPSKPPTPMKTWAGHEVDGKDLIGNEEWEKTWWLSMWHAGSRGINWKKAIPLFYTDDFHFLSVYEDPAKNTKKILNLGIQVSLQPNYTIYEEMPTALWVYSAYRSNYVARYFQEAGIKVIPDIQTGMSEEVLGISLIGIPENCPVVATQAQMQGGNKSLIRKKARLLKEAEDRIGFKHIIVYGHTDADKIIEYANFDCEVTKVVARTARRREYLNSGSTINSQKVKSKKVK